MIVTGCNGRPGLIYIIDGKPELIETGDTRGACYVGTTLFYLTREGLWRQRVGEKAVQVYEARLDWHGLHNAGESLLAPDPVSDLIHEFTMDGKYVKPINWKDHEARLHTNDCWREGPDLWLTCFGWGVVKNGEAQGYGTSVQPHSPIRREGKTFFCASNAGKIMCEGEVFATPGGFTRGLCPTPDGLWVGISNKRHGSNATDACIKFYDWDGVLHTTIDLPTAEVYAIAIPQT